MSLEAQLVAVLGPLVSGRVYPDTPPDAPTFPCIVYQQVGGQAVEYLEGKVADQDHARVQVVVWAKTRLQASQIARQARVALVEGSLKATTYGAPVSLYEEALKLYGARTDFSIWYAP